MKSLAGMYVITVHTSFVVFANHDTTHGGSGSDLHIGTHEEFESDSFLTIECTVATLWFSQPHNVFCAEEAGC